MACFFAQIKKYKMKKRIKTVFKIKNMRVHMRA